MRRRSFAIQSGNLSEMSDARDAGAGEASPGGFQPPPSFENDRDELGSSCWRIDERFDSDSDAAGSTRRGGPVYSPVRASARFAARSAAVLTNKKTSLLKKQAPSNKFQEKRNRVWRDADRANAMAQWVFCPFARFSTDPSFFLLPLLPLLLKGTARGHGRARAEDQGQEIRMIPV